MTSDPRPQPPTNPSATRLIAAIVLPPREGFGPGSIGAVGMIVRRLAIAAADPWLNLVFGGQQQPPLFEDVSFRAIRPVIWLPASANLRYAAALAPKLHRFRPSLVEVHNRPEIAFALARRLRPTPVGLFVHNDPQAMRGLGSPAQRARALHRLAGIVTVSDYLRRRFLEGFNHAERPPALLPNAIDLSALPAHTRRREPLILFAGRVVADKGTDAFVAACAQALPQLPGWRAGIIGADRFDAASPETPFTRAIALAAQKAGVQLLGYYPHDQVLQAMSRAAIVVVPSRWQEPFGLSALEAMASGAALVCSPRGALPELAGDAALYASPDDPAAMAAAIIALARNPERRAALAAAGQARARAFDLPQAATRLHAIRRWLMGGPYPISEANKERENG
jgi:UDP-glucose:(glucosyl)LPS alpha-1,2-glucosyltransferase